MKKPFINLMRYSIERSKWNPLRYLLGKYTVTSNSKKAWKQVKFDASDIRITPEKHSISDLIVRKSYAEYLNKNKHLL